MENTARAIKSEHYRSIFKDIHDMPTIRLLNLRATSKIENDTVSRGVKDSLLDVMNTHSGLAMLRVAREDIRLATSVKDGIVSVDIPDGSVCVEALLIEKILPLIWDDKKIICTASEWCLNRTTLINMVYDATGICADKLYELIDGPESYKPLDLYTLEVGDHKSIAIPKKAITRINFSIGAIHE